MTRDWTEWHTGYDDPNSALSGRLAIVQQLIRDALDAARPGPVRVLSLCSGDARDITGVLREHPRRQDVAGVLVELDERLAKRARASVAAAGSSLKVRCCDAADPAGYSDAVPVDLLLLVGVFGNIADRDVAATIAAVPALCRDRATIIWTRHRREPDLTPTIRTWFDRAGCTPVAFRSPAAGSFAVGCEQLSYSGPSPALPARLFRFRDDLG